jgi:hypothetical protein
VIAGSKKRQGALLGAKEKPDVDFRPAFEIILAEAANAQTGMKMGFPKAVANRIDRSRYLTPSRFREFPDVPAKRL